MEPRVGPDMSEWRVLVQFGTFRVQKWYFDEMTWWFCIIFAGEAQQSSYVHTKPCRTMMKLPQKVSFGSEACQIGPKLWLPSCPDLPRPVQEDKYLLQTSGNAFFLSDFIISSVLLNKIIIFCRIVGFTKWIYHLL